MSRTMLVPITNASINIDLLIVKMMKVRTYKDFTNLITPDIIYFLCQHIRSAFLNESVVLNLTIEKDMIIVGDIHGQYFDLLRHFQVNGIPPTVSYVFLGDYVDRGKHGIEVLCLLYALKIKYPSQIYLLRGDHECARINRRHSFYHECLLKHNTLYVWNAFVSTFNVMPMVAILNEKIICVHAGISPLLEHVDQLRNIQRPTDIPKEGLIRDLLWSDFDIEQKGFGDNRRRECSVVFGLKELKDFLDINKLELMIRGHECVQGGFLVEQYCITVFSAPDYCGSLTNRGATVCISKDLKISFKVCFFFQIRIELNMKEL